MRFSHRAAPAILLFFGVVGLIVAWQRGTLSQIAPRFQKRLAALWPAPLILALLFLTIAALSFFWAADITPWARRMPRLVLILAGFLLLLLVMTDKSLRWSRLALLGAFAVATVLLLHFLFYRMDMHKAQEFINRVVVVTSLSIWVVAAHFKLLGRSERENLLVFAGHHQQKQ